MAKPCRLELLEGRLLLSADAVLDWNQIGLDAVAVDHSGPAPSQGGPTRTARALAILHAAIYDSVNSIDRSYTPYLVRKGGPKQASIDAAVAQAAHDTLVALYPQQQESFDAALATALAAIPNGRSENQGIALGRHVARKTLRARAHDGSDLDQSHSAGELPAQHRPDPLHPDQGFMTAKWGNVKPFTMTSGDQFRSPPPPPIDSPEYALAFNEVKAFGGDGVTTLTQRTPEQTEIGIFWGYDGSPGLGTPPRLYNQIARTIAVQEGNSEIENARLFALINLAMADAGIASWETKYAYDFWRPIVGIREADEGTGPSGLGDNNPATEGDVDWSPLGAPCSNGCPASTNFTPNFPAYTSGHATFGAALFKILERFYDEDSIAFSFTSDEFNGVTTGQDGTARPAITRSFDSFSQAAEENGQSRIYLGIHWSFDKTQGIAQGTAIAEQAFQKLLRPIETGPGSPKRRGDSIHHHSILVLPPATRGPMVVAVQARSDQSADVRESEESPGLESADSAPGLRLRRIRP